MKLQKVDGTLYPRQLNSNAGQNYRHRFIPFLKFGVFLSSIIISVVFAGLYGMLNDQVTYTISPEYFTKFKYLQFCVKPQEFGGDRRAVAAIGFLATWWMGLIVGLVFGINGLVFKDPKTMFRKI